MTRAAIQELIDRHGAFAAASHAVTLVDLPDANALELEELTEAPCSICLLDLIRHPHMHTLDAHGKVSRHG
jgi:hypothetical protein